MRKECREFLENYISSNNYDDKSENSFYRIFKLYSAFEVRCQEDIKGAIDEFFEFFLKFLDSPILKRGYLEPVKLIHVKTKNLHRYLEAPITAGQKGYSKIIKTIAPRGSRSAILDVGAGLYPKSSIYLAKDIDSVSAMDKDFILSAESLKGMNVQAKEELFTSSTSVEQYDIVAGRFPCSAIIDIVSQCKKANKPYFLQLCDCKLPPNPAPLTNPIWTWKQVLTQIDPDIRFYNSCAFNIDASDKQMKALIEKHIIPSEQNISSVATWQGIEKLETPLSPSQYMQNKGNQIFPEQLEYARLKMLTAQPDELWK